MRGRTKGILESPFDFTKRCHAEVGVATSLIEASERVENHDIADWLDALHFFYIVSNSST